MMKKKIAITGGIGSGKSTLVKLIRKTGYDVYSCDAIYQKIINTKEYIDAIAKIFPSAVCSGIINKNLLAEIIFNDPAAREKLNNVAHPLIMHELEKHMQEGCGPLVFAEVPLLFECGFEKNFDGVIVVMRNDEQRIQSVAQRDNLTTEQVRKRIYAQVDYQSNNIKQRMQQCNAFLIFNNGNLMRLEEQWTAFLEKQKQQS